MDDLRIVVGPNAPALERFAASELQRYLRILFGPTVPVVEDDAGRPAHAVLIGSPQTNPAVASSGLARGWPSTSDQGIVLRGGAAEQTWAVGGGSPVATTWAVYELVERLGVRYLLSGDVFPDDPGPLRLPDLDVYVEPLFTERIWRLMNDEPHGPEMWSLAECRRVIDQIAKMKMNGIFFLTYPSHPFVHYEFRGVAKSTGVLDFGFRYPIDDDTIGREHFGDAAEFTNPEFRHCKGYDDMVEAGQRYARAVFEHARARGMRIGFGFSLTNTTDEFKARLREWTPDLPGGPADDGGDYARLGQLSMGAPPGGRGFQDVDNPALAELAEEIVRAHLETYPEIDFIEIGSAEFRAEASGYERCWRRLDEKYGIESVAPLKDLEEQARAREYHGEGRAERELKADVEFLYFVDKLFTEGRLLERLGRTDVEVLLSSVTEEMYPILGRVLPTELRRRSAHRLQPQPRASTPRPALRARRRLRQVRHAQRAGRHEQPAGVVRGRAHGALPGADARRRVQGLEVAVLVHRRPRPQRGLPRARLLERRPHRRRCLRRLRPQRVRRRLPAGDEGGAARPRGERRVPGNGHIRRRLPVSEPDAPPLRDAAQLRRPHRAARRPAGVPRHVRRPRQAAGGRAAEVPRPGQRAASST